MGFIGVLRVMCLGLWFFFVFFRFMVYGFLGFRVQSLGFCRCCKWFLRFIGFQVS